jgi:hypothetical protein
MVMRMILSLLLVVCVGLGLSAYWQAGALRQQRKQVQQLSAKLESESKTALLDLQEKCAKQAREEFKNYWQDSEGADFTNHYNAKLNRCFIRVQYIDTRTVRGTIFNYSEVFDAFERKVYAQWDWHTEKDKKYWQVPPTECKVTLPSGEQICRSSDEYDSLVKQLME